MSPDLFQFALAMICGGFLAGCLVGLTLRLISHRR